jgi:nickel and cobalt resistance protein CnrR
MKSFVRMAFGLIVLTAIAAAVGGWAGIRYGLTEDRPRIGLDEVIHRELNLTPEQNRKIETLEDQFAARRAALEQEMRAANRELAEAITAEHAYGPRAQSAIERFHKAESTLQEETVQHVLAMRTVLTNEQMRRFDEAISKSLTSD